MTVQPFDLRLDGESVPVTGAELTLTFDTPNDGFTAKFPVDAKTQAKLYKLISPYQATPAEVYIEGELMLTGAVTATHRDKNNSGDLTDIEGWSNTYNFVDSAIKPPYQLEKLSMHSVAIKLGDQTGTKVDHPTKFDNEKSTAKFDRVTVVRGQSAYDVVGPLASTRNHVVSSTKEGIILLQQANVTQKPIPEINEELTLIQTQFAGSWDLRNRYRIFRAVGQTPAGPGQATATDKNISQPRRKIISSPNDLKGNLESTAKWALKTAIIEELTQEIPLIGWRDPAKNLWKPDSLLPIVSETLFVPNGFEYFVRVVKFIMDGSTLTAIISLIPKEVYTDDDIVEPWFE